MSREAGGELDRMLDSPPAYLDRQLDGQLDAQLDRQLDAPLVLQLDRMGPQLDSSLYQQLDAVHDVPQRAAAAAPAPSPAVPSLYQRMDRDLSDFGPLKSAAAQPAADDKAAAEKDGAAGKAGTKEGEGEGAGEGEGEAGAPAKKDKAAKAKGKDGAAGKGKGKSKAPAASGKMFELIFIHEPKEPEAGRAEVPREPVRIEVATPAFSAPRTLPFTGVRQEKKPEAAPPADQADFRSIFAEAAETGFRLHQQLDEGARRIADQLQALDRRLADRHANALAGELGRLGLDLERARADLAEGRDEALAVLHEEMGGLRRRVWGAASSSLAKLAKLYTEYTMAMSTPETNRWSITNRARNAVRDLGTESAKALANIAALATDQSPAYVEGGGVWSNSINEAIKAKLPPPAAKENIDFGKLVETFQKPLTKFTDCLPCKFELAFAKMHARVDNVQTLGPKAIKAARDAGLTSIATAETQLEEMIQRGAAGTDDALVKQHDQIRARYIASAKANAASEAGRIEATGRSQARTLTAAAAAQSDAVDGVLDRLAAEKKRPESEFGRVAATASRRLRASLLATAGRQPAAAYQAVAQLSESLGQQADRFDQGIARSVGDAARTSTEMVESNLDAFGDETGKMVTSLKPVPGSIIQLCAGFLDPIGDSYKDAVAELDAAVNAAGAEIDAMLVGKTATLTGNGGAGEGEGEGEASGPQMCTMDDGLDALGYTPAEPLMSSLASPPPKVQRPPAKQGKPKPPPKPAPPPVACTAAGCMGDDKAADKQESSTKDPPAPPQKSGEKEAPKTPGEGAEQMTVYKLIDHSREVGTDVKKNPVIGDFQALARREVHKKLEGRAQKINTELNSWFPDGDVVVGQLRGTTEIQGVEYRAHPKLAGGSGLDARIRDRLRKGWAMPATIRANTRAALAALDGRKGDAALDELRASFHWSDQNERAQDTLLSLSVADLKTLRDEHGPELLRMARELSGADRRKFEALIGYDAEGNELPLAEAAAAYNAIKLEEAMKSARGTEGEAGWDKTGKALADASRGAGASALSGNDDPFGLEAGTERQKEHDLKEWKKTQIAYGKLTGAVAAPKDGKPPTEAEQLGAAQQAIIEQATKTITHHHHVSDPEGGGGYDYETVDEMGDRHKLWIRRIVETGADSKATRAAKLGIELDRKAGKPNRDGLEDSMHFGSADAIDLGKYNQEARDKGLLKAKADQDEVLKIYAQDELDRANAKAGICEESQKTPDEIREEVKAKVAAQFGNDKKAKEDALGILSGPQGNALATIELAIAKENKELAIKQLKRMDAREIQKLVAEYAAAHPGEPGLEATLGINGHHWSWHNWNGATFSGDDANEIEIAFMGVPQNPQERGEVALRIMDQQIDQSGFLGRALAGEEYDDLKENATELRRLMGVSKSDIDERGRIRATVDPQTGEPLKWGNFDKNGDFVPVGKGDANAFERAIVLSRITADNYVQAVDKIANFVATALVVIAAVVSTVATGGAAASIWIPVLVTAGAGLVGIGLNVAIKGERYSRDDIVRDLVATVVQAATAGIGAAAGAALRGGAPALKALSGSLRMSEQALAKAAGQQTMLRALTLAEDVAIGAGTSAFAGTATTALDPAARRADDYGWQVLGSFFRGIAGGAASAGAMRGVMGGTSNLARSFGARSGAREALARGASPMAASRFAALRARAYGTSALTEIGGRALATGAANALSRGSEMAFDNVFMGKNYTAGQFWEEMLKAGATGVLQGGLEGGGDRGMRRLSKQRAAEHAFTQQDDAADYRRRGAAAAYEEAVRTGLIENVTSPRPPASGGPAAPARAGPPEAGEGAGPARRPEGAPELDEAGPVPPRPDEAAPVPPRPDEAALDEGAMPARTADEDPAGAGRIIAAANDNPDAPRHVRIALDETVMLSMGKLPEGSVLVHPDSRNLNAANDNFGRLINADPSREVAVYHNPITGEYIVVQGAETWVASVRPGGELERIGPALPVSRAGVPQPGGHWVLRHHYHPNRPGEAGTRFARRLPSGGRADVGVIVREAKSYRYDQHSSRIYFIDNGRVNYTDFGFHAGTGKVWVNFPDPVTGARTRQEFADVAAYDAFLGRVIADPALAAAGAHPGPARTVDAGADTGPPAARPAAAEEAGGPRIARSADEAAEPRALAPGSKETELSAGDRAAVARLVADLTEVVEHRQAIDLLRDQGASEATLKAAKGWTDEAIAARAPAVKALGLVGEPDSMARLHLLMNDESIDLPTRQAIADTVASATRKHLIDTGQLEKGEPMLLMLHGATPGRARSIRKGGMQIDLVQARTNDDFGRAVYLTTSVESAEAYARMDIIRKENQQQRGEIFPYVMRGRDFGVVVDVSPAGPHRAVWEDFVTRNINSYGDKWLLRTLKPEEYMARGPLPFGTFDGRSDRTIVFERFLTHLAETTGQPQLAKPDLVLGELGGPMTSGHGAGDQQAMRTQPVLDALNTQLGFRRATPMAEDPDGPIVARTGDDPEPPAQDIVNGVKPARPEVKVEPEPLLVPPVDPAKLKPAETAAPAPVKDETRPDTLPAVKPLAPGDEAPQLPVADKLPVPSAEQQAAPVLAPPKPPEPAPAPPGVKAKHEDEVLDYLRPPESTDERKDAFVEHIRQVVDHVRDLAALDRPAVMAAMHARTDAEARDALIVFRDRLVANNKMSVAEADIRMRRLDFARAAIGGRFRTEVDFLARKGKSVAKLPTKLQNWLKESAVLRFVYEEDPARFHSAHARFLKAKKGQGGRNRARYFEEFLIIDMRRVGGKLQAGTDLFSRDEAVRAMLDKSQQIALDPAKMAAKGNQRPASQSGEDIEDAAGVKPGQRVDHEDHGRGTIVEIYGTGLARIHFDGPPAVKLKMRLDEGGFKKALEPDQSFDREPPVYRDDAYMHAEFAEAANYRQFAGLGEFGHGDTTTGTVARLVINGVAFHGTSSGLDPGNYALPKAERKKLFDHLVKAFGLKASDLGQAKFLSHAEAEALIRAFLHFGRLPEVVELFVDRTTCPNCREELVRLARLLGIKELRIYYRGQSDPPLVQR